MVLTLDSEVSGMISEFASFGPWETYSGVYDACDQEIQRHGSKVQREAARVKQLIYVEVFNADRDPERTKVLA
jgi:hypothetical protein